MNNTSKGKDGRNIRKENWDKINSLIELRIKQFEEIYKHEWYSYLMEDEMYQFLCKKLVEIKLMGMPTLLVKRELSKEDMKMLATGLLTFEEFMKDIEPIDNLSQNL